MDSKSIQIADQVACLDIYLKTTELMELRLTVSIGIFTKIYLQQINKMKTPESITWFFGDLSGLFQYIQENKDDRSKIIIHADKGALEVKSMIVLNQKSKGERSIFIELERNIEEELNQIRLQIKDDEDVRKSVEQLWRRGQSNEKVFMKFKEDVEYRLEEMNERVSIQNTKINIMREDINRISLYLEKLTQTVCPLLTKINIHSSFLEEFFLQDKKITYAGNSSSWTQLLLNVTLSQTEKFIFNFKILICKKGNLLVGVTKKNSQAARSSIKKQKTMVGYTVNGVLYRKSGHEKHGDGMGTMQVLRMIIDLQNSMITWKSHNKTLSECEIGELKGQQISPYLQFYDTGDAIEIL